MIVFGVPGVNTDNIDRFYILIPGIIQDIISHEYYLL